MRRVTFVVRIAVAAQNVKCRQERPLSVYQLRATSEHSGRNAFAAFVISLAMLEAMRVARLALIAIPFERGTFCKVGSLDESLRCFVSLASGACSKVSILLLYIKRACNMICTGASYSSSILNCAHTSCNSI